MGIHDLPEKWREKARGDAYVLLCADELEAHLRETALCYISADLEVNLEVSRTRWRFQAVDHNAEFLHALNEERRHAKSYFGVRQLTN